MHMRVETRDAGFPFVLSRRRRIVHTRASHSFLSGHSGYESCSIPSLFMCIWLLSMLGSRSLSSWITTTTTAAAASAS